MSRRINWGIAIVCWLLMLVAVLEGDHAKATFYLLLALWFGDEL